MPSNTDDRPRTGSLAAGYETRDVNTGAVLGFLIVLSVILGLVALGSRIVFRHYSISDRQSAPASSFFGVRQIPAEPNLQVDARVDLLKTYAQQRQDLETYQWEDRKSGTVRIPIERAMDLLVMRGLPVISSGAPRVTRQTEPVKK